MGRSVSIAVVSAALWLVMPLAHAAGLGKLTVLSPLGQPLNAEIEIVSTRPGELEALSARLADPRAFTEAGIELSPALVGMRFSVERRAGAPVLRVTTSQPVNEPFLEFLVELVWDTNRLVREYTVLLDPPEYKQRQAIAAAPPPPIAAASPPPVAKPAPALARKPSPPVEARPLEPSPSAPVAPPQPAPATAAEKPPSAATAPETPAAPDAPAAPAAAPGQAPPADAASTYEVKRGDTLGEIARRNLVSGVTLDQMLIAIYRSNEDAFIRGNINLVRAGRILHIPSGELIGTVDQGAASQVVKLHMAQFNEYRSRLAAAPAQAETAPGERSVSGQIEPKPEPPAPASAQDQLKLSQSDPDKAAAPGAMAAAEDDRVARERALSEAQSRVADLEKNVADLQKLLELKNQQLAELEKQAAAKPAPAVPAAPASTAPAPVSPSTATPVPEKPAVEAATPAPPPVAEKPAAPAPKPPAPAAKPKPRAKPTPPPPPPPSLLDEILGNPLYLGLLGLLVILLLAYAAIAWRRKRATQAQFQDSVAGAAAATSSTLGQSSVRSAASVPPASQAPVSQAPAGMEAEEVDPIAEADVYMAYGRDAQAEEILKEALQKDPGRVAVHAKLLEIYANRRDAVSFEQTALKLKNLTGGSGPDWEKAAALGRSMDPQSSLYTGAAAAAVPAAAAAAPALDFDLGGASQGGETAPDIPLEMPQKDITASGMDFDLGSTGPGEAAESLQTMKLPAMETGKTSADLEFNLEEPAEKSQPVAAAAAPAQSDGGLDFDLKLDLDSESSAAETPAGAPSMDLASISLDLGSAGEPAAGSDPKWQEAATKLDLAKAYEEMGDKDGARELLNEVMKDGDAAQKAQAQQVLAKIG